MADFLIFVRHTQTPDNAGLIFSGHRPVGLTPLGEQQAKAVATSLRGMAGVAGIVSSDLNRARLLANLLGRATGIRPAFDPRLREIDLGSMTGTSMQPVERRFQRPEYDIFRNRAFDLRRLGGESAAQVITRLELSLRAVATRYFRGKSRGDRKVIVVGHATAFEMLLRDRYGVIEHLHAQGSYDTVRWPMHRR